MIIVIYLGVGKIKLNLKPAHRSLGEAGSKDAVG